MCNACRTSMELQISFLFLCASSLELDILPLIHFNPHLTLYNWVLGASSAMTARGAAWNVSVFQKGGKEDWEIVKRQYLRKVFFFMGMWNPIVCAVKGGIIYAYYAAVYFVGQRYQEHKAHFEGDDNVSFLFGVSRGKSNKQISELHRFSVSPHVYSGKAIF